MIADPAAEVPMLAPETFQVICPTCGRDSERFGETRPAAPAPLPEVDLSGVLLTVSDTRL